MAISRFTIDGYGQVELNNVAFRRDGRIEAQCAADTTAFSAIPVENGMILAVNNVTRKVTVATDSSLPVALVYSAEHIYDERTPGLKNFKLEAGNDFYPRLGYLAVGDKWTTNCLAYDTTVYANDAAVVSALDSLATNAVYGTYCSNGAVCLMSTVPTNGLVLRAVAKTTMPDGKLGVKFQVYDC